MLTLNHKEMESVLLHELIHVARRDNLWRLIQTVIVWVFWFHPLVWWLHRCLIIESERTCDEKVVSLTGDGTSYAQGMVKAARYALGLEMPGFSGMARSGLSVRLAAILKPTNEKDHPMLRLTLILVALSGFIFTAGANTPVVESKPFMLPTDFAPRPIERVRPIYPASLSGQPIEGKVEISIMVDNEGAVRDPIIESATHPELGQAALEAVSQWKFLPGVKGGRNVNTRMTIPIVFTLQKKLPCFWIVNLTPSSFGH